MRQSLARYGQPIEFYQRQPPAIDNAIDVIGRHAFAWGMKERSACFGEDTVRIDHGDLPFITVHIAYTPLSQVPRGLSIGRYPRKLRGEPGEGQA